MKQRFSYLDLRVITNEVAESLLNCRLQNIYSLESSNRHFMFKFDTESGQSGKQFLIVDPGLRYHLTKYQHEPTQQPSHFVQKLRQHLKTRRASSFWVAPASRQVVVTFSDGQYFLVFEFFSAGNIILLDANKKILTLFRVVRDVGPTHQNYQIGEAYPLHVSGETTLQSVPTTEEIAKWVAADKLGKALYSKVSDASSSLMEYSLRLQGLDPRAKLDAGQVESTLPAIHLAVTNALNKAHALIEHKGKTMGYILKDSQDQSIEFEPFAEYFELTSPESKIVSYTSYNETVDEFFGAILSDKQVNRVDQLYALAESRLEAARNEKRNRVAGLEAQQTQNEAMGVALQNNADLVEAAIAAVKALVDQGVDWVNAVDLIKLEKEKGNNVAQAIDSLQLDKHQVTLSLDGLKVPARIDRSAYANARDYFDIKRAAGAKIEKTEQHASKALRSAEIKIKKDLEINLAKQKKQGAASQLHAIRQPHWFEKFWWFMTSTSHLVIAARDDPQKDILLRRYFVEGDVVMSSEVDGATLLIIKGDGKLAEIPPQALLQAASFCVATSTKAWESKSKAPSWFLTRKQVPKISEKGDPISYGDVRQITQRTWVPPSPTEMGMALLWQTEGDDTSNDAEDVAAVQSGSEDEFPDTAFDSDEFPDTGFGSEEEEEGDVEAGDEQAPAQGLSPASPSKFPPVPNGLNAESPEGWRNDDSSNSLTDPSEAASGIEQLHGQPENGNEPSEYRNQGGSDEEMEQPRSELDSDEGDYSTASSRASSAPPRKVRGGKKKMRKYQAQDEEDRKQAMERLGTLKGLERKAAEKEAKENSRKSKQELQKQHKERRRNAELKLINEAESMPPEQMLFPRDLLYKYSEDEPIVAAVPMFAPWSAIQKSQYKVKLIFGQLKKGKASTEITRAILGTSTKEASAREQQLLEAIRPVDIQQAIAVSRVQLGVNSTNQKKVGPKNNAKGASNRGKKKK